jgi:histidinol dehydrogenase
MPLSELDVRGLADEMLEQVLPRPTAAPGGSGGDESGRETAVRVGEIVERVRTGGDASLLELTAELDGVRLDGLRVPEPEIAGALARIPGGLARSLRIAWERLLRYHEHQAETNQGDFEDGIVRIGELVRPVRRAGLYAPGGRALYPSSVLMCAAPARVAGVGKLMLCVPPGSDGKVADAVLAAAAVCGIDEVHPVGGAQAIAAMAFGTESIEKVDVVVGPGNRYVAEAKRQVSGVVGVAAGFAGPSEVVVVADGSAPAEWAAIDLVVQAEHGPNGLAFLVTPDLGFAAQVSKAVDAMVMTSSRRAELEATLAYGGFAVFVDGLEQAIAVSNVISPEHLELQVDGSERLLDIVRSAGEVFVGPWAPASLGDYLAGTNHVLPTARTARFSSALRVDDFRTRIGVVSVGRLGLAELGPHVVEIATAEGLGAHADSIRIRSESGAGAGGQTTERRKTIPKVRADLVEMKGYHSPQVEVEVRLNANESAIPPPQGWIEELQSELARIPFNRYPDRTAGALRSAIGDHESVTAAEVFCANGSNEVLQSLLLAYGGPGRRVAVFEPTYALHRHIAMLTATGVETGWRSEDLTLEMDAIESLVSVTDPVVTFICSPNNPTGMAEPEEIVDRVLAMTDGLVVVDEAYGQFASRSAIDLVRSRRPGYERLVVTRTFSKTWSMAACRLGYMVADPEVVSACEMVALPYHLNAVTQAAGMLALRHAPEMRERIAGIVSERERVATTLGGLDVQIWPSQANFVLFRPTGRDARQVWQDLLNEQILVRDCSGWPGLSGCLRVTIGTPEENTRFLGAVTRVLQARR